jgi:hypothetical protein
MHRNKVKGVALVQLDAVNVEAPWRDPYSQGGRRRGSDGQTAALPHPARIEVHGGALPPTDRTVAARQCDIRTGSDCWCMRSMVTPPNIPS